MSMSISIIIIIIMDINLDRRSRRSADVPLERGGGPQRSGERAPVWLSWQQRGHELVLRLGGMIACESIKKQADEYVVEKDDER